MSDIATKMRDVCLTPMFTVDEQVMRVTNCESNGFTLVPGGVEPQVAEIPVTPKVPRDTVDAENIEPGAGGAGDFAQKEPDTEQPKANTFSKVQTWVKENPGPAAAIAAGALLLLMTKRK
jgi:hypothetical protein